MTAAVSFTRPTFTDNDTLTAAQFNDVTAASATVPDAEAGSEGVIRLAGALGGTAAAPTLATGAVATAAVLADSVVTNAKTTLTTFSATWTQDHIRPADAATKTVLSTTLTAVPAGAVFGILRYKARVDINAGSFPLQHKMEVFFDGVTVDNITSDLGGTTGTGLNVETEGHVHFAFIGTWAGGDLPLTLESTLSDSNWSLALGSGKILLLTGI